MTPHEAGGVLRFDGRVAIVTGAGVGMGREYALLLASRGAKVVVNDVSQDFAEKTAKDIISAGGHAMTAVGSVGERVTVDSMIRKTIDEYGRIDILINNAGINLLKDFKDVTPEDITQGYGRIANVTSGAIRGATRMSAYCSSKGAVWSLSNTLALEGENYNILVNSISPGAYTPMNTNLFKEGGAFLDWMKEQMPASAVAAPVAWLCHESSTVTGQCIGVFGKLALRSFFADTPGYAGKQEWTPEVIRAHWDEIIDQKGYFVARSTDEAVGYVAKRLGTNTSGDVFHQAREEDK